LSNPQKVGGGGFTFTLAGTPFATYVIQASADLSGWSPVATNTLPSSGILVVTDQQAANFSRRYYRAVKTP